VLKVIEERRVPVDCATGTSMGAIVGGAYAFGISPAIMEGIIISADWTAVFSDTPPRQEISIRRKADDLKRLFAPEFGVGKQGLRAPKGVVTGVSIESFLRSVVQSAAHTSHR